MGAVTAGVVALGVVEVGALPPNRVDVVGAAPLAGVEVLVAGLPPKPELKENVGFGGAGAAGAPNNGVGAVVVEADGAAEA